MNISCRIISSGYPNKLDQWKYVLIPSFASGCGLIIQCRLLWMGVLCVHRTLDTAHYSLYTVHRTPYTIYTVHCILYMVHCTILTIHCTSYTVHYTLYNTHCTLYIVHSTLYNTHYTPYTVYYTLYNTHCTMYTVHISYTYIVTSLIQFYITNIYIKLQVSTLHYKCDTTLHYIT